MDWKQLIEDLQSRGVTLEKIARECGFASKGAVHDLKSGVQLTCSYERGMRLVEFHKATMRKKRWKKSH